MCDRCTIEATKAAMLNGSAPSVPALLHDKWARTGNVVNVPPTTFSHVADLTHPLTPDFPSFFGKAFEMETQLSRDNCGFMLLRVSYAEHVGTHYDAPLHFSENGTSIDEIPLEQLICPLAVIDVREQSEKDHDYRLGVADIERFEALHGLIPDGSCVAMYSGWEKHLGSERFMNRDTSGVFHFPGFDDAAAAFLIHERQVAGIAVDTLSLDFGAATTSPVHNLWLPSGRYGIENVANLGLLPPLGATLIGGAPKIEGGTGGPGRVLALY